MTRFAFAAVLTVPLAVGAAHAAGPQGGLTVSPAFVEHQAQRGLVGAVTLTNGAAAPIDVTVRMRPWIQSRDGTVRPDTRRTLSQVKLTTTKFTLAPGKKQSVSLALASPPKAGSLYGAVEIVGVQRGTIARSGIVARYRLLGGLRLNPSKARRQLKAQLGAVRAQGSRVSVPLRNTGNTVTPITGSARITGPAGTVRTTISEQRILPGRTIDLRLQQGRLQAGRYTAAITLKQGGRSVAAVTRGFDVK